MASTTFSRSGPSAADKVEAGLAMDRKHGDTIRRHSREGTIDLAGTRAITTKGKKAAAKRGGNDVADDAGSRERHATALGETRSPRVDKPTERSAAALSSTTISPHPSLIRLSYNHVCRRLSTRLAL